MNKTNARILKDKLFSSISNSLVDYVTKYPESKVLEEICKQIVVISDSSTPIYDDYGIKVDEVYNSENVIVLSEMLSDFLVENKDYQHLFEFRGLCYACNDFKEKRDNKLLSNKLMVEVAKVSDICVGDELDNYMKSSLYVTQFLE